MKKLYSIKPGLTTPVQSTADRPGGRTLGIAFTTFAGFIVIGSVHLGWHYAIDDYAAIIGTWLIWWAVGRLLNRQGPQLLTGSVAEGTDKAS